MNVTVKTKGEYNAFNLYADNDMLKYLNDLIIDKKVKCEHLNTGMEVECKEQSTYEKIKGKLALKEMGKNFYNTHNDELILMTYKSVNDEHSKLSTDDKIQIVKDALYHGYNINMQIDDIKSSLSKEIKKPLLSYAIVRTLNDNLVLKEQSKVKELDEIEIELYGSSIEDIKQQFSDHKKELKELEKEQSHKPLKRNRNR